MADWREIESVANHPSRPTQGISSYDVEGRIAMLLRITHKRFDQLIYGLQYRTRAEQDLIYQQYLETELKVARWEAAHPFHINGRIDN